VSSGAGALLAVFNRSLLSHSLLDSITTGGKGVGWLWPWSDERFLRPGR
ncbi:inner membrane protein YbcI, partial [Salmonella enterica subsp. enterica serovar Enteritidis str. 53-407]